MYLALSILMIIFLICARIYLALRQESVEFSILDDYINRHNPKSRTEIERLQLSFEDSKRKLSAF